ncbi:MAG: type I-B CRISPR-associated protein Cas5b, partial [Desulfobacula sp.]|nr:type I-B CRISPR-associated protein Cas5b [Desulfobacula sp.]
MNNVLVFDLWGEYAHFRKYYTTTSPLTFSLPPRTALCGLIAGIIGLDKNEYLKHFTKDKADIAVRLLKPVKKIRHSQNLTNTQDNYFIPVKKGKHHPRTPIRFEFLKDAKFRIYFRHTDPKIHNKAREFLEKHKCVYTPCLGLSEHIANFEFKGEFECRKIEDNNFVEIDSAIPIPNGSNVEIDFEKAGEYFSETLPIEMEPDRTV